MTKAELKLARFVTGEGDTFFLSRREATELHQHIRALRAHERESNAALKYIQTRAGSLINGAPQVEVQCPACVDHVGRTGGTGLPCRACHGAVVITGGEL